MPNFEFDPEKSRRNEDKHGVDFEWAQQLWKEDHVILPAKEVAGEVRSMLLARIKGSCYAALFTKRGESIRLISCHRADQRLENLYEKNIQTRKDS